MSRSIAAASLLAVLISAPGAWPGEAAAQGRGSTARAAGARDPGNPATAVPPARYTSAFARYRPNAEAELGAWRELNATVGRIGGWRVYGREAIPEAEASDAPAADRRHGAAGRAPQPAHEHKHEAR